MRGRATVRDLSMFAGWFGLPKDEFSPALEVHLCGTARRAGHEGDRNSDRTGAYPWSSLQDISPLSRSSASPTSQAVCASSNRLAALLAQPD